MAGQGVRLWRGDAGGDGAGRRDVIRRARARGQRAPHVRFGRRARRRVRQRHLELWVCARDVCVQGGAERPAALAAHGAKLPRSSPGARHAVVHARPGPAYRLCVACKRAGDGGGAGGRVRRGQGGQARQGRADGAAAGAQARGGRPIGLWPAQVPDWITGIRQAQHR